MDLKTLTAKLPRLFWCALFAILLFTALAFVAPQQIPVMMYKVALVLGAGYLGYLLDRWVFPYASPAGYLEKPWTEALDFTEDDADHAVAGGYMQAFLCASIRRALIICAAMLAVGLGL